MLEVMRKFALISKLCNGILIWHGSWHARTSSLWIQ